MSGYGDIEEVVRAWIDTHTDANVTVIVEPADGMPRALTFAVPLVTVTKIGGSDPVLTLDDSTIDISVYASTYAFARALASDLHVQVRRDLPNHRSGPITICRATTVTAPRVLPWDATNIIHVGGTYDLRAKVRIGQPA